MGTTEPPLTPDGPLEPGWLDLSYDAFPRVEASFNDALAESLHPRGPDLLYELVAQMGLARGARAVDVGCGEGAHALRLAEQFGLRVVGLDPVARNLAVASAARAAADPEIAARVTFEQGGAEALPLPDASQDLVWCRDVLVHVADLDRAYAEFHRVLRTGGRVLVYTTFAGVRLEPREAVSLWKAMGVVASSRDPMRTEAAIVRAGLRVDQRVTLGSEWGEFAEEESGGPGRRLLAAARLLRDPERYIRRFGRPAYDIMLGDCLWHVYGMIGKLDARVYVLTKP